MVYCCLGTLRCSASAPAAYAVYMSRSGVGVSASGMPAPSAECPVVSSVSGRSSGSAT